MPLFDYLKLKWKRRKSRKNLRYFGPNRAAKLDDEHKTSIYIIMDYIRETMDFDYSLYKDINDEYYLVCVVLIVLIVVMLTNEKWS